MNTAQELAAAFGFELAHLLEEQGNLTRVLTVDGGCEVLVTGQLEGSIAIQHHRHGHLQTRCHGDTATTDYLHTLCLQVGT